MPRPRVAVFITPHELCALIANEAPKHGANVYGRVAARLVPIPLPELVEIVSRERARELYLALPNAGPDYEQDWHFALRHRKLIVSIEMGESDGDAVQPTILSTDPEGIAMVVLRELERAVSRLCQKYVRLDDVLELKKAYWSPALAGRSFVGCEPVLDEVSKVERAAAALRRPPKWKPRP